MLLLMLSVAALAGGSPAFAQFSSCIPTGEGAAPYSGDWTRLHRDERIALCKEGERREQERQRQARKEARDVSPPATAPQPAGATRPEPITGEAQAAPDPEPCRRFPESCRPILRGRDASGVPIITDDPNFLRR
jgi:hypothetical protein